MGRAKQEWMERAVNDDLIEFLKDLSDREELKGAIDGIAKQVISKGVDSMTEKQKVALDSFVENYKEKHKCSQCSNDNVHNLTELIEVADHGICSTCKSDWERVMRD